MLELISNMMEEEKGVTISRERIFQDIGEDKSTRGELYKRMNSDDAARE